MLWRSPWEAAAKNSTNNDFFSRDQGLAALAAFTRSKNASLYEPWLKYITGHQGCMCPNRPYGKGNFCKLFVGMLRPSELSYGEQTSSKEILEELLVVT